ncbi:DMT family transporter [Nioella sp.]|uniref:DMT family transporter n=1 Tax=Nioella sp. TaxID=1912091 RepID=UPI003B51E538
MARSEKLWLVAVLLVCSLGWGISIPMSKIAVSEGYRHVGIIFWQFVLGAVVLGFINRMTGRGLPTDPRALRFYLIIALIGTLLPNSASYTAAIHLPGGILALCIAMVPMLAFPIALAWGNDRFSPARLLGLCLGLAAIAMIMLPETSLPDPAMLVWVPVGLIAPAFYAFEGNYVARHQPADLDAVQVLLGASLVGIVISLPIALLSGEWISPLPPYGLPDLAVVISSVAHALSYAGYVWLVGRGGPVFAVQISYLVTGFSVGWSWLLLGETYSPWVWGAFALMLMGVALVQPRAKEALAVPLPVNNDGP